MCVKSSVYWLGHKLRICAFHNKQVLPDGAIVEMKKWEAATPVASSTRNLKYNLYYGMSSKRLVGYDKDKRVVRWFLSLDE